VLRCRNVTARCRCTVTTPLTTLPVTLLFVVRGSTFTRPLRSTARSLPVTFTLRLTVPVVHLTVRWFVRCSLRATCLLRCDCSHSCGYVSPHSALRRVTLITTAVTVAVTTFTLICPFSLPLPVYVRSVCTFGLPTAFVFVCLCVPFFTFAVATGSPAAAVYALTHLPIRVGLHVTAYVCTTHALPWRSRTLPF